MRSNTSASHPLYFRSAILVLLVALLPMVAAAASASGAEPLPDGAALFQKHCSTCHPHALRTSAFEELLLDVRTPPIGMPAFSESRLSDGEVRAIQEHLYRIAPADRTPRQLEASLVGDATADHDQVPADPSPDRPRRTLKERKAWLRGFGTQ